MDSQLLEENASVDMNPTIFIIILNWNGLKDTLECLESVYKLDYPDYKVLVVDNGSTDESVKVIREVYPEVTLIENKENLGYSGGNNIGMRYALENKAEYVWLLNNDAVVEPDSLSKLISAAEGSTEIGLASPCIYYYDEPDKIQFCGSIIDWKKKKFLHLKDQGLSKCNMGMRDMVLWGTALLIKRNVIESIGFLNEEYFSYHEDHEYSTRAIKNGYINIVVMPSKVYHKEVSSSGGRDSPLHCYYWTRNIYFFWTENMTLLKKLLYIRKYISNSIYLAGKLIEEQRFASADARLDGMWSALHGITGPWENKIEMPRILKRIISACPFFWSYFLRGDFVRIFTGLPRSAEKDS